MESSSIRSWEEFVVALKIIFAPSTYDDPAEAFTKLQQASTVDEYQSEFEVLSNRIPGLPEEEVRIMVSMFKPTTLPDAFELARLQEQEVYRRNRNPRTQSWSSNPSYPRLPPPPNLTKTTNPHPTPQQFLFQ
jgi:hypothetical protein